MWLFGMGTALHNAARAGYEDAAIFLLQNGINRHIKDTAGKTAAERAEEEGHLLVADIIRNNYHTIMRDHFPAIKREKHGSLRL